MWQSHARIRSNIEAVVFQVAGAKVFCPFLKTEYLVHTDICQQSRTVKNEIGDIVNYKEK